MTGPERRSLPLGPDRRRLPRGGRRAGDQPGRYPNLLVADSYDGARVPCVRYLSKFGFHVDQAADGHEALALIKAKQPHVILVEEGLPAVPAMRLVRPLHNDPTTRDIRVIVMTSDFELTRESAEHGEAAVLVKPFALSLMLQEIRKALREQLAQPS